MQSNEGLMSKQGEMNENLLSYGDYSSGHIWLPININESVDLENVNQQQDNKDKEMLVRQRDLYFRYESLNTEATTSVNRSAIANLRGLLAFRMGKYEQSLKHFESVSQENEENVNALQNLAHVYAQLNMQSKAEEMSAIVRVLLGRSENVNVSNKLVNHRVACSLAEHAVAYAYDVGLSHDEMKLERLEEVIALFDRAINLSSTTLSTTQRREWFYFMLVVFVRIDKLLMRSEDKSKRLNMFNRALNIAKDLERSDRPLLRSTSSVLLGIMLERQTDFKSTPISVHDCGYTGLHSLQCYTQAIEAAEKDVQVLNNLAKVFQMNGKHELAIAAANMSVEIDDSDENICPFHTRAKVHTTIYMRDLARSQSESCVMPDRELLEKAREDLEKVIRVSPCLRTYVDIGQTCYYIGADAISEDMIVDEGSINSALVYFSKALDCEMGKSFPELQLLRGKCMKIRGEDDNALECFKQAALVERKGSSNTVIFNYMLETYMNWFCQSDEEKRKVIVDEVDEWMQFFLNNFNKHTLKINLRRLAHERTQQLLQLCRGTIQSCKFTLPKMCFEIFDCED